MGLLFPSLVRLPVLWLWAFLFCYPWLPMPGLWEGFWSLLCPGCGLGFFFVRLPVCLYVGSRWLLVIFSVVVVAVSSLWGGGEGFPLVYHFPVNYIPSNFKLKQILCYKCC